MVARLMMKERIAAGQTYGKWDDVWIEHPEPTMNEPHKAMWWLTAKEWIDEDREVGTRPAPHREVHYPDGLTGP